MKYCALILLLLVGCRDYTKETYEKLIEIEGHIYIYNSHGPIHAAHCTCRSEKVIIIFHSCICGKVSKFSIPTPYSVSRIEGTCVKCSRGYSLELK